MGGNPATCNAAFLATLTDDGLIRIRDAHVLASMLPTLPASGAGFRAVSLRQLFYALLSKIMYDDVLLPVLPRPVWLGHFARRLCDCEAGMPTTAVDDLLALRARVESFAPQLNAADRTITAADRVVTSHPPPAGVGWFHSASTAMLRDAAGSYAQVANAMLLMPYAFC